MHGNEEHSVSFSRTVDRDDVRVVQRGREPRLAQEALSKADIFRQLPREELESDHASKVDLLGEVDLTHPATCNQAFEPVTERGRA